MTDRDQGYTVVHRPHVCSRPNVQRTNPGTVVQCACGQQWRAVHFPLAYWRKLTRDEFLTPRG